MNCESIFEKALSLEFLTKEEGLFIYKNAGTPELMFVANEIRKQKVPGDKVTWLIDRNVNITMCAFQDVLSATFTVRLRVRKHILLPLSSIYRRSMK